MPNRKNTLILRLGTRKSPLALAQSTLVAKTLERLHRRVGLRVELVTLTTTGDRDQTSALAQFGGTGVFTKELESALLTGIIDFAVHSLKDLPIRQPRGLSLAAVTKREDVRDVALTADGRPLKDLPSGALVGSGSPRRQGQLRACYPGLRFAEIRGNVDTRIRKVREGQYAATILARAGLKRLSLPEKDGEILPLNLLLPAPGQGALGLECRSNDRRTKNLLKALHHPRTAACVEAERACLAGLGGGCHLPLGAHGQVSKTGRSLALRAALVSPDGAKRAHVELSGAPRQAQRLGRRAARMIKQSKAGREILATQAQRPNEATLSARG